MFQTKRHSNRNLLVLGASVFGLALGEELWLAYLPAYLSALGAGGLVVGAFASARDFLDSAYQYPGGWLADRWGRRRALRIFTALAFVGYAIYAAAPGWPLMFGGLLGVMAWKAGAFPTTFAVIGDSLPPERRATAFGVQSILVRVPRVIGAPIGGLLIGAFGVIVGIRIALVVTLLLAASVLGLQQYGFRDDGSSLRGAGADGGRARPVALPPELKRLLAADCLVRIGEGVAASFIILFVLQVRHLSAADYGVLYAVQHAVSIAGYVPGGRIADRTGRGPLVALTFVFFALFPLAVRCATTYPALLAAFCLGGLKEIGEPARQSLIVDLAGGLLWRQSPTLPLEVAFIVGVIGALTFWLRALPPFRPVS